MVLSRFWRILIILAGVLLLILGIFVGFRLYQSRQDSVVVQDTETEILPSQTRESLKNGKCSDDDLAKIKLNVEEFTGKSGEVKSLTDLANCYTLRNEYDNALGAYKSLEQIYTESGNTAAAASTQSIIVNIEQFVTLPKESPAEIDSNEPLAN